MDYPSADLLRVWRSPAGVMMIKHWPWQDRLPVHQGFPVPLQRYGPYLKRVYCLFLLTVRVLRRVRSWCWGFAVKYNPAGCPDFFCFPALRCGQLLLVLLQPCMEVGNIDRTNPPGIHSIVVQGGRDIYFLLIVKQFGSTSFQFQLFPDK